MSAVMEEKTFRGLREIAVLGLLAGALFLFISLFTFSIEDAGWTHSGTGQPIRNAGGVIGAWLADICLSFFGLTAYLFPVIIVWQSVLLYKRIAQTREQLMIICLGIIAFITATAALMHLYMLRVGIELPRATGGILGEETGEKALNFLGNSGATIFLLVLLLASITLVTELSWVKLIDNVGKYVLSLSSQLWSWLTQLSLPKPSLPTLSTPTAFEAVFEAFNASDDDAPIPTAKPAAIKAKPASTTQAPAASQHVIVKRPTVTYDASQGVLPSLELLDDRVSHVKGYSPAELDDMSRMVESILNDFNVSVTVVGYQPGPVITRFELQPAAGVKVSRISTLAKDLARALLVTSVRIVEIIPGKSVVGLEIPNREREMVNFRELMASPTFTKAKSLLTLGLGKDIAGVSVVADLAKMPHALVAGTTGSGKSVAINAMILSLLYKATPQQVRMIMIDPKMLELSVYEGIPHLLTPVVTDMKEASNALRWAVAEMERRYKLMSKVGVRNLAGFNQLIEEMAARGEAIKDPLFASLEPYVECPELTTLPSIVIIIDELADMMMIVGKKVEELIARLAQKARAAGIHLILATQRPSVDVLTGLIKANVPTRISFQVSSRIDSRTILDQGGAEALLGNGDMLFLPSGTSIPIRAHGAFVDDHEVHRVVEFLKLTAPPDYLDDITKGFDDNGDSFSFSGGGFSGESSGDEYYDQAVRFVTESRKASISSVQRRFKIGYNRAASIIEEMEKAGIVSPAETNGSRVVLAPPPPND